MRENLRNPGAAEFLHDYGTWNKATVDHISDGEEYPSFIKVRGANGFGGKAISYFICNVRHARNGTWSLVGLKEMNTDSDAATVPAN